MASKILKKVLDKFEAREQEGLVKYGTTMDRGDLSLVEWLNHLQEELMDATLYVQKLKEEITDEIQEEALELMNPSKSNPCESLSVTGPCGLYDLDGICEGENLGEHPLCSTDFCPCKEEEIEKRMNIIGQNGNDGLHYEKEYITDIDGKGAINYKTTHTFYPGDVTITYEEPESK